MTRDKHVDSAPVLDAFEVRSGALRSGLQEPRRGSVAVADDVAIASSSGGSRREGELQRKPLPIRTPKQQASTHHGVRLQSQCCAVNEAQHVCTLQRVPTRCDILNRSTISVFLCDTNAYQDRLGTNSIKNVGKLVFRTGGLRLEWM